MRRPLTIGLAAVTLVLATRPGAGAELPQYAPETHTGVATCASSVCHGRVLPDEDSSVLQNEYRTWSRHDRHSGAYQTLLSSVSRSIAGKLGIGNAHEAAICLDCHADNVDAARRGQRFHIEDGVGCEACHGGAQRWLTRHATSEATHEDNLAAGMYPTDDLAARAELCLSCHLGTSDKFATHRIMGAGHPRLAFELDTFTIREPEHYIVDEDYRQRKSAENPVQRWAVGALVTARRYAELLQSPLFLDHPVYPEIGLFDCHSCHDGLGDLSWRTQPATAGLGPGQVRLNDSSMLIAAAMLSEVDSGEGERLYEQIKAMHSASGKSRMAVVEVSKSIVQLLEANRPRVESHQFTPAAIRSVRSRLLDFGLSGEFHDYAGAEQAVMSVDVLSFALDSTSGEIRRKLDELYGIVSDDDQYLSAELERQFQSFRSLVSEP